MRHFKTNIFVIILKITLKIMSDVVGVGVLRATRVAKPLFYIIENLYFGCKRLEIGCWNLE